MNQWRHKFAHLNGIDMHYVEENHSGADAPVVLLLHGFPHLWWSWRHQIGPIAEAGYRVVVPDMRGMGRTSSPADVTEYDIPHLTADMLALLDHVGADQATLSGLDFGMMTAYDLAHQHPERVRGLVGLQNPFINDSKRPPSQIAAKIGAEHFHHMHYFMEESRRAEVDLDADPRGFLTKVFYMLSGEGNYLNTWKHPVEASYLDAMDAAPPLPWSWLTEAELEIYVENYAATGFLGPINWYRSSDVKWQQRKAYVQQPVQVPYYFIGSENDIDLAVFHGEEPWEKFAQYYADVRGIEKIPAAGHMVQMEDPDEVNQAMLRCLNDLHSRPQPPISSSY